MKSGVNTPLSSQKPSRTDMISACKQTIARIDASRCCNIKHGQNEMNTSNRRRQIGLFMIPRPKLEYLRRSTKSRRNLNVLASPWNQGHGVIRLEVNICSIIGSVADNDCWLSIGARFHHLDGVFASNKKVERVDRCLSTAVRSMESARSLGDRKSENDNPQSNSNHYLSALVSREKMLQSIQFCDWIEYMFSHRGDHLMLFCA